MNNYNQDTLKIYHNYLNPIKKFLTINSDSKLMEYIKSKMKILNELVRKRKWMTNLFKSNVECLIFRIRIIDGYFNYATSVFDLIRIVICLCAKWFEINFLRRSTITSGKYAALLKTPWSSHAGDRGIQTVHLHLFNLTTNWS